MAEIRSGDRRERLPGRWFGLAALSVSGLVLGLDITILITALPTLSAKLDATTDQLQWMSAAYTLSLAGFMLPAGVLGDRFGRPRLLLIGLVTFGISSVIASQMTSANGLILMRVVMGASGAIVLPLVTSILPSMFAEDERQRAIGISGAGVFIGLPLGPLVAGWLLTHYDWGSIFLINAPVVVIAVIGIWFFVPESRDPNPRRLDWLGALLEMVGVTGLVYGIIEEPVHGWANVQVAGPIAGGALLIVAFIAWQLRTSAPLVDLNLFRNRRFALSTVAFTIVGFAMTGVLFVLSPYLQVVQHNDAQGTGVRLLPLIAAMMVGAVSSDWLSKRVGAKVMVAGGMLGIAASMLLLSRAGADSGYGLVAIALAAMGLSIAFTMIPALDAILGALPAGQTGAGSALTRAIQNVGASFGVAVMGSVLNSAYQAHLSGQLAGFPAADALSSRDQRRCRRGRGSTPPGAAWRPADARRQWRLRSRDERRLDGDRGLAGGGAVLMALFLPARAPQVEQPASSRVVEVSTA